ncbi:MAG: YidC/Oxa1 family membrane protein insertase, partial [Psychrobacter sp.]
LLGFVDLTQHAFSTDGINIPLIIIAIGAAVLQFFMSKQTMPSDGANKRLRDLMSEAASGKEPDQAEMNAIVMRKMMKFLPFMMFFIMINLPGALVLFYAMSNVVALIQQSIILKKDEHELEQIADEPVKKETPTAKPANKPSAKPSVKARAKDAKEATVTRISAKDTPRRNK